MGKPLAVGSLFTGVGMFDLGFVAAGGYEIKFQIEIDEFCQKVLHARANFFNNPNVYGDIRDCGIGRRHELPCVDILIGGFPCTDLSLAGDRAGLAEGTRSGLWYEFRRLIDEIRPRCVVIENVPPILSPVKRKRLYPAGGEYGVTRVCRRTHRHVPAALIVIQHLAKMGYVGSWGIISAADTGAPHKRDRWWLVGYSEDFRRNESEWRSGSGGTPETLARFASTGEIVPHAESERCERHTDGSEEPRKVWQRGHTEGRSDQAASIEGMGNTRSLDVQGQREVRGESPSLRSGTQQSQRAGYRARRRDLHQPRLGGAADGTTYRVDRPLYPAPPGDFQYPYEPPRSVGTGTPNRNARLKALGNGLMPIIAYALAQEIKTAL